MPAPEKFKRITSAPAAFRGIVRKLNQLIRFANIVHAMSGDGLIKVVVADGNIRFSLSPEAIAGASGFNVRKFPATLSAAGVIPTASEVSTAINDAYSSAGAEAREGDLVFMTEFHYLVTTSTDDTDTAISSNDVFRVNFTTGFTAFQFGPNRLY